MKTFPFLTHWAMRLLVVFFFVGSSSCSDDDEDDQTPDNIVQMRESTLTADQEEHPVTSSATGTFTGTYDKETKILNYTITWSGVNATNMHFHKGELEKSGPIVIPIGAQPYTSPINAQTPPLTPAQEADMLAGLWYVNIHSNAYPIGEIRGQVLPQ